MKWRGRQRGAAIEGRVKNWLQEDTSGQQWRLVLWILCVVYCLLKLTSTNKSSHCVYFQFSITITTTTVTAAVTKSNLHSVSICSHSNPHFLAPSPPSTVTSWQVYLEEYFCVEIKRVDIWIDLQLDTLWLVLVTSVACSQQKQCRLIPNFYGKCRAACTALGQHRQNNLSHFREFFVAKTIWGQFQFWRVRIKDINNFNTCKIVVILFFQQKIFTEILLPLLNTPLHRQATQF